MNPSRAPAPRAMERRKVPSQNRYSSTAVVGSFVEAKYG
jgi:hypothetical protein